jgi:hypothetical protein
MAGVAERVAVSSVGFRHDECCEVIDIGIDAVDVSS